MAKNKKSKILAMALCASVMTGIYASPVMAAQTGLIISSGNIIEAEDKVVINGVTMTGGRLGVENGIFAKTLNINYDAFTVDKFGNTVSKGDVTSTAADGTTYTLNTVGNNTQKVTFNGKDTVVAGKLVANKFGTPNSSFYVEENGTIKGNSLIIGKNGDNAVFRVDRKGAVKAANGAFTVDKDGNVTGTEFTVGGYNLTDIGEKTAGITQYKNDTTYFKGAVNVEGSIYSKYGKFVIGEDSATYLAKGELNLGAEDGQTLTADKLSTINSVITDKGEVVSQGDVKSYDAENDRTNSLNKVASDLNVLEGSVGDIGDNVKHVKHYDEFAIGDNAYDATVIEDSVAITNERGIDVIGDNGTSMAVITKDGVARFGDNEGPNVRLDNGDLEIRSNEWTTTAVIRNDGTARFGADADKNIRMVDGVLSINSKGTNAVASLSEEGLMLSDEQSRSQTLNATDIADIKGIDRDIVEETFGDVKTTTKTTTIEGALKVSDNGFISNANESFTVDANGTLTAAGGRFTVSDVTGAHFYGSDSMFSDYTNINGGRIEINGADGSQTVINGNSITTETLNVENIKLGNSMTDKDGNTITIGAAGVIDIEKDGNTVFRADTDNFEAHYDNYDLTLDGTNGFALSNETSKFTLNGNGFAFAGPVNLGAASDVKFGYTGNLGGYTGGNYNLSQLVDTVNDIYNRTDGIYKDADGNTVISNEKGTWNETNKKTEYTGEGSKITIGDNGTTFENGEGNGTTNINGSEIVSDATNVESGSGSGSGFGGGTSTTNGDNAVYVGEDGDYTHVSSDGVTIGDKTNTNTTNIDKDGMVVDGETGNTHISEGGMTVTDKTDNSTTNIDGNGMVVNGSNGTTHISDSGMTVTGDNGTTNISGGDISVDNSVTVGSGENQTVVNNDGVTVGGEEGTSIKHDEISVGDGGYIGGGDVVSGEGVSLNQTAERVGNLENRVGELEDRIDKVGAMAAAIANLRTMGYDPAAPTEVAVGIGQYRDETGAALGLFHYPNRDFMLSLSVSTSGDEVMGGIGATWKFGRKSPEKVAEIKKAQAEADARRAEEAKLAKAEEMKQAAKEAKIKAQQERHAKLAAERAAQAEAAK